MMPAASHRLSVAAVICISAVAATAATGSDATARGRLLKQALLEPSLAPLAAPSMAPFHDCGRHCSDCLHRQACYTCMTGYYNVWGECMKCEEGCLECMGPMLCRCCDAESGFRMADGPDDVCTNEPMSPAVTDAPPSGGFPTFLSASPAASLEAGGPAQYLTMAPLTAPAAEPSAAPEQAFAPFYAPVASEWMTAAPVGLIPPPPADSGDVPPTEMCCQYMSGTYLYNRIEDPRCKKLAHRYPEYTCPVCWLNEVGRMECKDHVDDAVPRFTAIAPATVLDRINTTGTPAQAPLLLAPRLSPQVMREVLPLDTSEELMAP